MIFEGGKGVRILYFGPCMGRGKERKGGRLGSVGSEAQNGPIF